MKIRDLKRKAEKTLELAILLLVALNYTTEEIEALVSKQVSSVKDALK